MKDSDKANSTSGKGWASDCKISSVKQPAGREIGWAGIRNRTADLQERGGIMRSRKLDV
jgi:hypothetical protein